MENISVQKRDFTVKAKKLRRSGIVPGIVFGSSLPESISIQMHENAARNLVRRKREGSRLGESIIPVKRKTALIKGPLATIRAKKLTA
mgnify:CR=1 FL=1